MSDTEKHCDGCDRRLPDDVYMEVKRDGKPSIYLCAMRDCTPKDGWPIRKKPARKKAAP
jgi:hypothetical protein